jgi:hypothetical protein
MPYLTHLIGLGIAVVTLEVDLVFYARLPENVMATARSFFKSQAAQQPT